MASTCFTSSLIIASSSRWYHNASRQSFVREDDLGVAAVNVIVGSSTNRTAFCDCSATSRGGDNGGGSDNCSPRLVSSSDVVNDILWGSFLLYVVGTAVVVVAGVVAAAEAAAAAALARTTLVAVLLSSFGDSSNGILYNCDSS